MTGDRIWRGVRRRDTRAGAAPGVPARPLTSPAAWDDHAAAAWIRPVAGHPALADRPHAPSPWRRAARTEPIGALHAGVHPDAAPPGFVPDPPAFHDPAAPRRRPP